MSYLVLARKLRPTRFDDLIGQETAAQTLRNAVLTHRVAHAFLFTGSRGVGKTSAARILTKALNCLQPQNGDPCNDCENCSEITQGSSADVYEIDAASNRGIENIRELRENVNYVPARCNYKIYIIDEAHMLTTESFNALLKTLEEPPPHVKFIFATTDPHKIPQTIISRCQRYDFLRISVQVMTAFLEKVVKNEGIDLSRKALEMVARNSVGGMRDALTAIDQILSFTGTAASDQEVAQILGILDSESRFAFAEALLKKDAAASMRFFHQLQEHGHDVHDLLSDLLNTIKTISLVRTLGTEPALFQDLSQDDLKVFSDLGQSVTNNELQQIFQILLNLEEQMKRSAHARICFEMGILQIASVEPLVGLPEMIQKIKQLQKGAPAVSSSSKRAKVENISSRATATASQTESPAQHASAGSIKSMLQAGNRSSAESTQPSPTAPVVEHTNVQTAPILPNPTQTEPVELTSVVKEAAEVPMEVAEPNLRTGTESIPQEVQVSPEENLSEKSEPTVVPKSDEPDILVEEIKVVEIKKETEKPETQDVLADHQETQVSENEISEQVKTVEKQETQPTQEEAAAPENIDSQTENQNSEPQTETPEIIETNVVSQKLGIGEGQYVEIPSEQWLLFTEEVAQKSLKLGGVVRNSIPVDAKTNELKLNFKSKHYASMLSANNLEMLESITSDWCGLAVRVICSDDVIDTTKQSVLEHEHQLQEEERERKRESARNHPQVLDILSVFENSTISNIKLAEAE